MNATTIKIRRPQTLLARNGLDPLKKQKELLKRQAVAAAASKDFRLFEALTRKIDALQN